MNLVISENDELSTVQVTSSLKLEACYMCQLTSFLSIQNLGFHWIVFSKSFYCVTIQKTGTHIHASKRIQTHNSQYSERSKILHFSVYMATSIADFIVPHAFHLFQLHVYIGFMYSNFKFATLTFCALIPNLT
jgi:hypothetical protein